MDFGQETETLVVKGPAARPRTEPPPEKKDVIRRLKRLTVSRWHIAQGLSRLSVMIMIGTLTAVTLMGIYLWRRSAAPTQAAMAKGNKSAPTAQTPTPTQTAVQTQAGPAPTAPPLDITLKAQSEKQLSAAQQMKSGIAKSQEDIDATLALIRNMEVANAEQDLRTTQAFATLQTKQQQLHVTLTKMKEALDARKNAEQVALESIKMSDDVMQRLKAPAVVNASTTTVAPRTTPTPTPAVQSPALPSTPPAPKGRASKSKASLKPRIVESRLYQPGRKS